MNAARTLLTVCTNSKQDEVILFVTDNTSRKVCDIMWEEAIDFPLRTIAMMSDRRMHGDEPPKTVAAAMANADVIFGITKFSMFHTEARRNAIKKGARFANMADYSVEMFDSGGLFVDFIKQGKLLDRLSDILDELDGKEVLVTTKLGTDISFSVEGREAIRQYGRSINPGMSSSPPDIETALGPVEGTANGRVVIDGSIPHPDLGLLSSPIILTLNHGRITSIDGDSEAQKLINVLKEMKDDNVYFIAEMGIGLNNYSKLSNRMLEDEGVMGTMHFGFGSNISFGGSIESNNHIDMVFKDPNLTIDGFQLMDNGKFVF